MNNLQTHINNYLEHCRHQKRLDSKTLKAYRIDLQQFYAIFSCRDVSDITPDLLENYIGSLHQKYKPKTVKRKIASVKALFHYLEYKEGRGPADGVLVRRGGVPHGRGSPQLAARCRGPRGLPERRSHRPARPEHGGLLGADPGLNRRKLWKNLEDYDMMVVSLILRPRTGRERRKQLRNDPNSRCLCSTIRRSS